MERFCLRNGLRVILKPEEGLEITSGALFFPVGNSLDPKGKEGLTLLTLKTAVKRSSLRNPDEFYSVQEVVGAPFVSEVSLDYSLLRFQSTSEGFSVYSELLLETLLNPDFSEENFKVERDSLLAAIRSKRENPFTLAYEKMMELTYRGTPYEKLPYGSEESVGRLTPRDCESWYGNFLIPKGAVLSLCGKLKGVEDFLRKLEEIPPVEVEREGFSSEITEEKVAFVKREGSAQSFILLSLNAPSVESESYVDYKILNTILGEGIGSVLFQELREKKGFAYSTGSLYPSRLNSGRIFVYIGTSPDKEEEVRGALRELLKKLPSFISGDSLERAREYFRGTYLLDHETRGKRAWYLGFWEVMGRGSEFDDAFLNKMDKVGIERVREVAESISREPFHEVVVRDEEGNS